MDKPGTDRGKAKGKNKAKADGKAKTKAKAKATGKTRVCAKSEGQVFDPATTWRRLRTVTSAELGYPSKTVAFQVNSSASRARQTKRRLGRKLRPGFGTSRRRTLASDIDDDR